MKLTKEQALQKIEELKKYVEQEEKKGLKMQGYYIPEKEYYTSSEGVLYRYKNFDEPDTKNFLAKDMHQTKKESQEYWNNVIIPRKNIIVHQIKNYFFEPDWRDIEQLKYFITLNRANKQWLALFTTYDDHFALFPYLSRPTECHRILKECKEDFDKILNYYCR
jgi:hypothetical protein